MFWMQTPMIGHRNGGLAKKTYKNWKEISLAIHDRLLVGINEILLKIYPMNKCEYIN